VSSQHRTADSVIHADPIEVAAIDGRMHITPGTDSVTRDRTGRDDLVHALIEALDCAAAQR
jgi:hypothetical protein